MVDLNDQAEKKSRLEENENRPQQTKKINSTQRFSSLIRNNQNDLKDIAGNIEKYLNTEININEKLRKALLLLKERVTAEDLNFEDENEVKVFIDSFMGLVETYYYKLIELFNKINKGFKPLIKFIQIFEVMLENFNNEKYEIYRSRLTQRAISVLKSDFYRCSDWKFMRKLSDCCVNYQIEKIISDEELLLGFYNEIQKTRNILTWRNVKYSVAFVEKVIIELEKLKREKSDIFFMSLRAGRFEKKHFNYNIPSLIVGDEGGLYALMNSLSPDSQLETIMLEAEISKEFLNDKRGQSNKVVLGKGAFGKVRLAMSLFGSSNVDVGQIICVKKSLVIKPTTFGGIIDSAFEDFLSVEWNESIHSPKSLDMAIITDQNIDYKNHRKAYNFMEIVPENSAEKVFKDPDYQKWEYQKPYIIEVLKTMEELLVNRVFNSDLKPQNTLFDCHSRKTAIIDLGSSIYIDKDANIEKFDISIGGFGVSQPYCPPELTDSDENSIVNLWKSISYLCGVTIAEIMSQLPNEAAHRKNMKMWEIGKNTDLTGENKKEILTIINKLTELEPDKRMHVSEAIPKVKEIGLKLDIFIKTAAQQQYVFKARELIKKDPTILNLYADINSTKLKGIIELNLVESNPKRLKKQKSCKMTKEIEDFLANDKENVFVILGEAGSGKSLSLQLKFVEELEKWDYGKAALPIFFNMADEVDFDTAIRRINTNIGCNLKLEEVNEDIHMFIDSYDEGATSETKNVNFLQNYVDKLKNWKNKKIVISCRTDFVQTQGEDDLSYFMLHESKELVRARYIAPIGYGIDDKNSKQVEYELILNWLKRENPKLTNNDYNRKVEKMHRTIKKLGLDERMNTGLMFNMIMNMLLKNKNIRNTQQLRGFEIYKSTIREEFNQNYSLIVSKDKQKEKNQLMKSELKSLTNDEIDKNSKENDVLTDIEIIWNGLERLGELVSAEMTKTSRNRLKFKEVEKIITKDLISRINNEDMRMEWKTLYQICRVLGLKLEKRKTITDKDSGGAFSEETDVGFRHETYKNYYLLRGLKRVFLKNMKIENDKLKQGDSSKIHSYEKFDNISSEDEKILSAILDDHKIMRNYELLRFFGEEVKNSKDSVLREGLRTILRMEQEKYKKVSISNASKTAARATIDSKNENSFSSKRASIAICLLIAGDYSFSGEDLSYLDLSHANMRGGIFCNTKFEKTLFVQAILRHADVTEASFLGADLTNLDVGLWPDLVDHKQAVNSVCFSPDGNLIASGSRDKTIKIWDSLTGELKRTISDNKGEVNCVCFSPDGITLASSCDDKTVKLWDFNSGNLINRYEGHQKLVKSVDFNPKGAMLASGSDDKTVNIWRTELGSTQIAMTLKGHEDSVYTVCFSPSGILLASGSRDKSIRVWEWETEKCIKKFEEHKYSVYSVHFSLDGNRLASASWDNTIKLWTIHENDTEDKNKCLLTLEGHRNRVYCIRFSPDGKRLTSGSWDNTVKIWDSKSGECIQTLFGHDKPVISVSFSPDGKRITSGGEDGIIKLWDNESGECVQGLKGHKDSVYSVCFSRDGKQIVSGSRDKTLKLWDSLTGECLQTFKGHKYSVYSVSFSPDAGTIVSGSDDNTVRVWDTATGKCLHTLKKHNNKVTSVCFSPDGVTIASGSEDNSVILWDSQRGKSIFEIKEASPINSICLNTEGNRFAFAIKNFEPRIYNTYQILFGKTGVAHTVGFSHDGRKIASGSWKNKIKIWECESGDCLLKLEGHDNRVTSVNFSPDDKTLASSSWDLTVKIWDSLSGKCLFTMKGHKKWVNTVAFHPSGEKIASGSSDNSIIIWDSRSGNCLNTLQGHKESVFSVHFNPDPNLNILASGSEDNMAKIWDTNSGKCLNTLEGHKSWITCVRFNYKGKKIATASRDNTVKIWDSTTGICLRTLEGHSDCVYGVCFKPNEKVIASCGENETIKFWMLSTGECFSTLEKKQNNNAGEINAVFSRKNAVFSIAFQPSQEIQKKVSDRKKEVKDIGAFDKFVSASSDNTVKIWNLKPEDAGKEVGADYLSSFKIINEFVYRVCFCPIGDKIATASSWDNRVRIWTKKFDHDNQNTKSREIEGYNEKEFSEEHKDRLSDLCFSHDGERLASSSWDHTIKIWKLPSDKADSKIVVKSLLTIKGHPKRIYCINFSPDDKKISSGSEDFLVYLWDSNSGQLLTILNGHQDSIYGVVFSPGGGTIASCSGDKTIKIWECLSGKCLKTFSGHTALVSSIKFHGDGKILVSGSYDKTVRVWDTNGLCLYNLQGHKNKVSSVFINPDGLILISVSYDKTIKVWDLSIGNLIETLTGDDKIYSGGFSPDSKKIALGTATKENKKYIIWETQFTDFCVAFSPDGRTLASGSWDKKVNIWNISKGERLKILKGHKSRVYCLAYSNEGAKLASGSWDKTIKIWDCASGRCLMTLEGHDCQVYSVGFDIQGKTLASGSSDKNVILWDCENGKILNKLLGHSKTIYSIDFCPDSSTNIFCTGSEDSSLKIWDKVAGSCLMTLEGHKDIIFSVCFSPDGKLIASASRDKTVKLWNRINGQCISTLKEHTGYVYCVTFSLDGLVLATAGQDKSIKLWDMQLLKNKTAKQTIDTIPSVFTLKEHEDGIFSVSFSRKNRRLVSGSWDKTMKIWDLSFEKCYCSKTIQDHKETPFCVSFSQNGEKIANGWWDGSIRIWESRNLQCILEFEGHNDLVSSLSFNPIKDEIASASWDCTVKIWNTSNGKCLLNLVGHLKGVNCVKYSADGKIIASGAGDNEIRIWKDGGGQCLHILKGHGDSVNDICFSPDGSLVASCSEDKSVILWDVLKGKSLWVLKEATYAAFNWINFSKDGNMLILADKYWNVKIAFAENGGLVKNLSNKIESNKKNKVSCLSFHSQYKLATSCHDNNKVLLWDLFQKTTKEYSIDNISNIYTISFSSDGKKLICCGESKAIKILDLKTEIKEEDSIMNVIFSTDGNWLASASINDYEVVIWDRATEDFVLKLEGHKSWVNALAFSSDKDILASASSDCTVKIWNFLSSKCINTLKGHRSSVICINFSPDGKKLVSGSRDLTVKIWSVDKGECIFTFPNISPVISVCFSENGECVQSGSKDGQVKIWDSNKVELLKLIYKDPFHRIHFGVKFPVEETIVTCKSNCVKILDYSDAYSGHVLNGHNEKIKCVNFSPDGLRIVSGGCDNKVNIWDSSNGQLLEMLGVNEVINSVCFSPEGGSVAYGCKNKKKPLIWNTRKPVHDRNNIPYSVCFSQDGLKVFSASWDHKIQIWDLRARTSTMTRSGHQNRITSICCDEKGDRIASGSWDKTIKIWDTYYGSCMLTLSGHEMRIYSVISDSKGKLASGSSDNKVILWNWGSGEQLLTLQGHTRTVLTMSFSSGKNTICTAGKDKSLKIWDTETGDCLKDIANAHENVIFSVCFSQDSEKIVSASLDKRLKIWKSEDGELLQTIYNNKFLVYSVSFSSSNLIAGGCEDNMVRVWNTSGFCKKTFQGHSDSVYSVCFLPNNKDSILVSGSGDKTIKTWSLTTKSKKKQINVGKTNEGISYSTHNICYSSDGKNIVGGCSDNTVKVWNSNFGYCVTTLKGHDKKISSVCFSPDGSQIASSSFDKTVKIWKFSKKINNQTDFYNYKDITLEGHRDVINSVCFSPDGSKVASCSNDKTIRIYDSEKGNFLNKLNQVDIGAIYCICFSPNIKSDNLVSGSNSLVHIWNSSNGKILSTLKGHSGVVNSVCFTVDCKWIISGGNDSSLKIWNSEDGECLYSLLDETHPIKTVCVSPDGIMFASANENKKVKLWNISSRKCVNTLDNCDGYSICFNPTDGTKIACNSSKNEYYSIFNTLGVTVQKVSDDIIRGICFSPNGERVAVCSKENFVEIWDCAKEECVSLMKLNGHQGAVYSVSYSPEGFKLATASEDGTAKVWEPESGNCKLTLEGHTKRVFSVNFSPDSKKLVTGGEDNLIKVWDSTSGSCQQTLKGHTDIVFSVCFNKNGSKIVSGSGDKSVKIWRSASGDCLMTLAEHKNSVNSVSISTIYDLIISGSDDNTLRIWNSESGECLHVLKGHNNKVKSVSFSPDGINVSSCSYDKTIKIWNSKTGKLLNTLEENNDQIYSACFSSDGKKLAFTSNTKDVSIWKQELNRDSITCICFSPDGKNYATGSHDNRVTLWESKFEKPIKIFDGHRNPVYTVCYSPDGENIASGGDDKTIKIWNLAEGKCTQTLEGHKDSVTCVCYSPVTLLSMNLRIASCSRDKTIKLWEKISGKFIIKMNIRSFEEPAFLYRKTVFENCEIDEKYDKNSSLKIILKQHKKEGI